MCHIGAKSFVNYYLRETGRNLNKRIYEYKTVFEIGNSIDSLVSLNILTNYTLDFQVFALFAFLRSKNK